ncbi:AfsA-related hotdog domain-containing protein [Streptomyces sp. NPDC001107]
MPRPALTATVPRQLVHRAAVAETLLTDWECAGPDRLTLFAQWPRAHRLHVSPDRSAHEPLLVAETVRQGGALLAHAEYDAPFDHCFVLKELHLSTCPEHHAVAAVPAEPVLDVTVSHVRHRAGRPTALRYDTDVRLGGERVATALPLPPVRPGCWQLRVDTAHPVCFDHPLDRIPGMPLLKAARHAARVRAVGPAGGGSCHAAFHQYAELDRPTWIEVADETGTGLEVCRSQGESTVFECAVGAAAR